MNKKNKAILLSMTMLFSATTVGLIAYGTYCAFLNNENQSFEYENQIRPLNSYFDGGNGIVTDPYVISDVQSFVDFQKLVQLGCFDYNTYFILGSDIDFGVTPTNPTQVILDPIGSHSCPFRSQFDGRGKKLKNVVVSSVNHEDIGLFGYVANGAALKNFILDTPKIVSTGPTTKVENPLKNKLKISDFKGPTQGNITDTSIKFPTTQISDIKDNKIKYNVYYRSSVPEIMSDTGVLQTGYANMPKYKFQIHFDAIVTAYLPVIENVVTGEGTSQVTTTKNHYMVVTYVVERFIVNIDGNKKVISKDKNKSYEVYGTLIRDTTGQTPIRDPHYYKETRKDASGKPTDYILDNVNYVGFIVGHLDGYVEYIGVYNGTIKANIRRAVSFSSLIGRDKDDNSIDSVNNKYYYQHINFSEMIKNGSKLNTITSDAYYDRNQFNPKYDPVANPVHNFYTNGIDDNYTNLFNRDQPGIEDIGIEMPDAFRVYKSFGIKPVGSLTVSHYDEEQQKGVEPEITQAIYLKDNLDHFVTHKPVVFYGMLENTKWDAPRLYNVDNGFWVYSNKNFLDPNNIFEGVLNALFGQSKEVFFNLRFQYSVDNAAQADETDFIVYDALQSTTYTPNDYTKWWVGDDAYPQLVHYIGLDNVTTDERYSPTKTYWHFHRTTMLGDSTGEVDTQGKPIYGPLDPKLVPVYNKPDGSRVDMSKMLLTKTISISSKSMKFSGFIPSDSDITYDPVFIVGINNKNSALHPVVNIHSIELIISFDNGNFSYTLNNVDFLYDITNVRYTAEGVWENWARTESGVKIYFIIDDTLPGVDQGLEAFYERSTSWGNKVYVRCRVIGNTAFTPGNSPASQIAYIYDPNGNRLNR